MWSPKASASPVLRNVYRKVVSPLEDATASAFGQADASAPAPAQDSAEGALSWREHDVYPAIFRVLIRCPSKPVWPAPPAESPNPA